MNPIGLLASFLTTFGFVPQVLRVIKTKDTSAISLGMYSMMVAGIILWLYYGITIGDTPLIFANSVSGVLSSIILFYKIKETLGSKMQAQSKV